MGMIAEGLYNGSKKCGNKIKALFTAKPYVVTSCAERSYKNMVDEILYGFGATHALYPDEIRDDVYDIVREVLSTVRAGQCPGIWKGYAEECDSGMQNPIVEDNFKWILHCNCEGTEQLQNININMLY